MKFATMFFTALCLLMPTAKDYAQLATKKVLTLEAAKSIAAAGVAEKSEAKRS